MRIEAGPLCSALGVEHALEYPTRLAHGPDGRLYVSDVKVGSVFVQDGGALVAELKGLGGPLGVAVDAAGRIYVGSRDRAAVEVYGPAGGLLHAIGAGAIGMPNDLALDAAGLLYVADSAADAVRVYDTASRALVRVLEGAGDGSPFHFPAAVAVTTELAADGTATGELYVADQGNGRIVVFDLEGRPLRQLGERMEAFDADWQGRFVRLQSVATDGAGRVYAADSRLALVQVLDADGGYLGHYGRLGRAPGELYLPLDVELAPDGALVVANAENHRIERFVAPQGGE
ncbi:MAG: NHL repeat-containing protein [Polyangiaceae bacterium]|nr:NHL repeat-containing protein [Polyangiaceae bacterium]